MKYIAAILILFCCSTVWADTVTIDEYLDQQGGTVASAVCCDEEQGDRKLLLLIGLAAIPFAFIDRDNPPVEPPSNPTPTPVTSVPEATTLTLMTIGLFGIFAGLKGKKAMRRLLLTALAIGLIAGTALAKDGKIHVMLEPAMPLLIEQTTIAGTGASPEKSPIVSEKTIAVVPGSYTISAWLPDGNIWTHEVMVHSGRTCDVWVKYRPPTITEKTVTKTVTKEVEKPVETPCPDQPVIELGVFDWCCECKRDELKAHLDLFGVELNSNPHATGYVSSQEAKDYLVNDRKMTASRIIVKARPGCQVMWIQQK